MSDNKLFEKCQSGFRPLHNTETALVKITNDLLKAADSGQLTLLVLLDLSAAFDTVSHNILLDRLASLGITGTCLSWGLIYKMLRRNHPKFDLTIISKICVSAIHRMNVRTEIARTRLFQMINL